MEITYYTDGVVWVTNQRLVYVDMTYWLADIRRAEVVQMGSRRDLWVRLAMTLSLLILTLFLVLLSYLQINIYSSLIFGSISAAASLALLACSGRIMFRLLSEPFSKVHLLRLYMGSSRQDVCASLDLEYLETVVDYLEFTMKRRNWDLLP